MGAGVGQVGLGALEERIVVGFEVGIGGGAGLSGCGVAGFVVGV